MQQRNGEKLNELTEEFFRRFPRDFDAEWPSEAHRAHDLKLRAFFERIRAIGNLSVREITKSAKEAFDIEL